MNFVSVRIITDDVARLSDFYEKITGAAASRTGDVFAELATSSATLAIGSSGTVPAFAPGAAEAARNRSAIIEFLTPDVDADYARLRGVVDTWVTEPALMPWGNRSVLLRDPDGNLVNLFTPATAEAIAKFAPFMG
ncbi:catechol 2,3-dioxygenase-like lactoylglutathione lyase family enzyme [Microbacterium sp. SORGH_AS428]|uniref:VOC family protein n=1 Tax=Microbacterium sp. SORGH_AS_0428 TaxID=3041788 RepID=UPI002861BB1B|nr:VOC family protein [Microbacterium sp. SORGH_AS_0428]MDR6199990.1 catechol 2,3-dioxygenase-like lactoylglutathione lyase family enzyme [Microbacterium sp. SORGH_AS_0428]